MIEECLLGEQGQECVQSGAVELGGIELDSGAEQSCAAEESNSLPLAFSCLSCSVSFLICSVSRLSCFILCSWPGSRRQLSVAPKWRAVLHKFDKNNRQRGNDEPDAPLLVEGDDSAEDVEVVIGAIKSNQANNKAADELEPTLTVEAKESAAALLGFWRTLSAPAATGFDKTTFNITVAHSADNL